MQKIPNITSLRFFLALLVMIFHIPQFFYNQGLPSFSDWPIFNKGSEAVYMFFSLSGFLIIGQLYNMKNTSGNINLKIFFTRRALRILPLYYMIVFIGLIYYNVVLPKMGIYFEREYSFTEAFILLFTFFPNVFSTLKPGGILEILWSIGIEEQFYLLFAPLLFFLHKKNIILFLIIFSFLFLLLYYFSGISILKKYNMMFYFFSFAGFCSLIKEKKIFCSKVLRVLLYFLIIVYFITDIFSEIFSEFQYHLFSMVVFGIFINVLSQKTIRFFENKYLVYLGKISYGIYMYHAVVMQLIGFIFIKVMVKYNLNNILLIFLSFLFVISLTILISHISYKYYEKIFLDMKKNYKNG